MLLKYEIFHALKATPSIICFEAQFIFGCFGHNSIAFRGQFTDFGPDLKSFNNQNFLIEVTHRLLIKKPYEQSTILQSHDKAHRYKVSRTA